ncbi:MAG: orotidine 5'-phosphate decarboxylase / HUMPS family protein [Candidatus Micrarchaeota archaeon]
MLERKKRYLQLAFNQDSSTVARLLPRIPRDERIIIEAGTPYIKREGERAIRFIRGMWGGYVVADIKTMDGAAEEAAEAAEAGANGATVLGAAPKETLDVFIESCAEAGIDSFVDMIGVEDPLRVLMKLKKPPHVVVLHKGRDEESTRSKFIKYVHIKRVRSKFDVLISAAGGIDLKAAQSASFNGADIVAVNIVTPDDPFEGIATDEAIETLAVEFLRGID